MIFQNPQRALNPFWKVSRLVGEAVRQREKDLDKAGVRKRGISWLERVRLNNPERVWNSHPHELSGGMAQRVMVAASLARGARLLFADEPTTGLDTTVKARIVELFSELRRTEKLALVVISHDLGVVSSLANRIVVMKRGDVIETRRVEEITGRSSDLHEYTRELLSAVDVWSTKDKDKDSADPVGGDQASAAKAEAATGDDQAEAGSAAEAPAANPEDKSAEDASPVAQEAEDAPSGEKSETPVAAEKAEDSVAPQEDGAAATAEQADEAPTNQEAKEAATPDGAEQETASNDESPEEKSDGAS